MKQKMSMLLCGVLVFTLGACAGTASNGNEPSPSGPEETPAASAEPGTPAASVEPKAPEVNREEAFKEPLTLTFSIWNGEQDFPMYKEAVESKFPNVTLEFLQYNKEAVVTGGAVPDIVLMPSPGDVQRNLVEMDIGVDLMPLVEKYGTDLSAGDPNVLANITRYKGISNEGLYAFPHSGITAALYYNKDIFDKFAVPYPTDGMTWEQVIELARQVTKEADGIQYIGLLPPGATLVSQLALEPPAKADEPTMNGLNKEQFEYFLNISKSIAEIPGIWPSDPEARSKAKWRQLGNFREKNVAMTAIGSNLALRLNEMEQQGDGFSWEMVSYPQVSVNPGVLHGTPPIVYGLSKTVKNLDAAYQVIEYLSYGEFQEYIHLNGIAATHLTDAALVDQYADNVPGLADKDLSALFALPPNVPKLKYDGNIYLLTFEESQLYLNTDNNSIVMLDKDNNTLIREMQEAALKRLAEEQAKRGAAN